MMIGFKSFVEAIHEAIAGAADVLMDKNHELLGKYFETVTEKSPADNAAEEREILKPKIVNLDYPTLDEKGKVVASQVQVPLITLVPITASQVEKATLTAEFQLSIVDDELFIDFSGTKKEGENTSAGKLEIVISPKETTEGFQQIIAGYEMALKRQIS
ncbi:MAG: DUF2589 domain-containing protein [Prevotellaceae bacterium]|jgi:hypothetical protein|nr:DUF2589 domain-containing protein [Prevotellaceae bacterium]